MIGDGKFLLAEQRTGATPTADRQILETLGGGYYREFTDIAWGATHVSLTGESEPTKSAIALCFKQSVETVFRLYECTEALTITDTEIELPIAGGDDVSGLSSSTDTSVSHA